MSSSIDSFVKAVAPTSESAIASVRFGIIVGCCIPMVSLTVTPLQLRATILLLFNIFVRLLYPSAYYPASASVRGFVAHPLTARCIAFVAEFSLYEIWAVWSGVDFWGPSTYLWLLVGFGEVTSTTGTLLQSELILNIEDTTWAIHTCYMCYLSYMQPLQMVFFGGFGAHMLVSHLPRRFALMYNRGRAKEDDKGLFHIQPLFTRGGDVIVRRCLFEEKAWVVPMLLGQPVLTALMYWQINAGHFDLFTVIVAVVAGVHLILSTMPDSSKVK